MSALCEGELKARKKAKAQAFCQSSCLVSFWKSASSLSNFVCVCLCACWVFERLPWCGLALSPRRLWLVCTNFGNEMPEQKHIETQSDGNCNSHQSLYMLLLPLRPKRIPRRCWTFLHSCSCGVIIFLSICQYMHVPSWSGNQGF